MKIRCLSNKVKPGFGAPNLTLDKIYPVVHFYEDIEVVTVLDNRGFKVWLGKNTYVEVKEE